MERNCNRNPLRCGPNFEKVREKGANWNFRFYAKAEIEFAEVGEFHQGVAISWVSNKSPMVTTSKEAWDIQAVFYGFDMAMMLKGY